MALPRQGIGAGVARAPDGRPGSLVVNVTTTQTFKSQALAAIRAGAKDEHGNSRVEFPDGSYATFVSGKTWAHWPKP